jgi:hypothetical protein
MNSSLRLTVDLDFLCDANPGFCHRI